jgi:hypothetical protein
MIPIIRKTYPATPPFHPDFLPILAGVTAELVRPGGGPAAAAAYCRRAIADVERRQATPKGRIRPGDWMQGMRFDAFEIAVMLDYLHQRERELALAAAAGELALAADQGAPEPESADA